jgi:Gluconate 2-dehydrogenase subunit 3
MQLTPSQHHALQSICDTFAPQHDGWPSASQLGVPEAIASAMDFNPRLGDRQQILQLLDNWDTHLHALLTIGRMSRFSSLSEEARASAARPSKPCAKPSPTST